MKKLVTVRDLRTDEPYYALTEQSCQQGDFVVLELAKGQFLGQVQAWTIDYDLQDFPHDLAQMAPARPWDIQAHEENQQLALDSQAPVRALIDQHHLPMTLLDIAFSLDRSLVFIRFKAEHRVDFRALVRDLAGHFRCRVELHQVNDRESAKIHGGLGPCGRALCCSSFLGEFPPVSIKMMKNQGLSLKSDKHTGLCGRLMCCLSFEDDFYSQAKQVFPDLGTRLMTKDGPGNVVGLDIFNNSLDIHLEERRTMLTYQLEEVTVYG